MADGMIVPRVAIDPNLAESLVMTGVFAADAQIATLGDLRLRTQSTLTFEVVRAAVMHLIELGFLVPNEDRIKELDFVPASRDSCLPEGA